MPPNRTLHQRQQKQRRVQGSTVEKEEGRWRCSKESYQVLEESGVWATTTREQLFLRFQKSSQVILSWVLFIKHGDRRVTRLVLSLAKEKGVCSPS